MAKLSDKQKKFIIAERVEGASIRALAKKYKVSTTTIQRILKSDTDLAQKVTLKKEENAREVLSYLDSHKTEVCTIIGRLLDEMQKPQKLASAPIDKLATTMGILIDKFSANEINKPDSTPQNNLFDAINGCVKEGEFDDLPELQQEANADSDMVEQSSV